MNANRFHSFPPPGSRERPRRDGGLVLLIVLGCIGIMAILIVSFLIGANSEVTASKLYSASTETQNLSSSALNLVMGLVSEATDIQTNDIAWASQPGLIRRWNAGGTAPSAVYKLYSSPQMRLSGADAADFDPANEFPPADWDGRPAFYTDLNAPSGAELRFPIVDPRAMDEVEGFSYDAARPGGGTMAGVVTTGTDTRRLPMPVSWLYVLRDGSFVAPSGAGGDGGSATVAGASAQNPIVGRIAFWTDDESCKVNINTAAEGHYWDTPMASFAREQELNGNYPAKNEFTRYAGHPATTSLSPIFPELKGKEEDATRNDRYYRLAPRIEQGGSLEGTVFTTGGGVTLDADRLYDNVDELAFDAVRAPFADLSAEAIARRRFFLTAQGRSPETTLFNTSRVALWPLHSQLAARHASEKLIALAATTGKGASRREYFFTRGDATDPDADFNDATRDGRNRQLLAYLQDLTSLPVPGYPNTSFHTKWGGNSGDRDQILVQIYDYIRSCINLRAKVLDGALSTQPGAIGYTADTPGRPGTVAPTVLPANTPLDASHALRTATRGFGRFPTIREVSMLFAAEEDTATSGGVTTPAKIWPALLVECFLPTQGPKPYSPNLKVTMRGLQTFQWEISPSQGAALTAQGMFPDDTKTFTQVSSLVGHQRGLGGVSTGYIAANFLFYPGTPPQTNDPSGPSVEAWGPEFRFLGGTVTIDVELAEKNSGSVDPAHKQTFEITFPPMSKNLPLPKVWWDNAIARRTFHDRISNNHALSNKPDVDIIKSMVPRHGDVRLVAANSGPLSGGAASDPAHHFVPHAGYDSGLPDATTRFYNAHTLHANPALWMVGTAESGDFIDNPPLPNRYYRFGVASTAPSLPPGAGPVRNHLGHPGDWDNGLGNTPDGPFVNKPDEGLDKLFDNKTYISYMMYANQFFYAEPKEEFFGPMRQIASPVLFGSLPSGVVRNRPWETLLFCPNPASGWSQGDEHPGFATPPDHLLLDLFWMPVTEPYAISDSFSTAGKINLNHQIIPFGYITRETGLRAVLANQRIPAFAEDAVWQQGGPNLGYKTVMAGYGGEAVDSESRYGIDAGETLKQWKERFDAGKVFRSTTEICELFLVPKGFTLAQTRSASGFWSGRRVTGDNMRERPYNALYPRLTTRSNTFTLYVKAQALRQTASTLREAAETFTEGRDVVEGEFQAAYTFERYLDPNAPAPESDLTPPGPYRIRVINQRNLSW